MPLFSLSEPDNVVQAHLSEAGVSNEEARQYRHIYKDCVFLDKVKGEVHMDEVISMILDGFEQVVDAGVLSREPCMKLKVSLVDTKLHEDAIHRGPAQMYPAIREGIRGAMMQAGPIMFEPLQVMRIETPNEYVGEISKLVSSKRGQLLEMNQEGDITVVKSKLPVGELFGWSNDLRSATAGRGNSSLVDQMFERLPGELQEKIKSQIVSRKGLSSGQVS